LTSPIKPVYVFTGMFAEYLFSPAGPGMFSKDESGQASVQVRDNGDAKWSWTTMQDAAEFSIDLLTRKEVQEGSGGYFSVTSGDCSPKDIARAYENVTGVSVDIKYAGTLDNLDQQLQQARQEHGPSEYMQYVALLAQWFGYRGRFHLQKAESVPGSRHSLSLEDLLRGNPDITRWRFDTVEI
jgi:nucleoside-diphosphate-sugar epimerase